MKVNRLVVSRKEEDLDIAEVTLLSREEYEAVMDLDVVPARYFQWWLRSPYHVKGSYGCLVDFYGGIKKFLANYDLGGVCPALRIHNLKSIDLNPGDKFVIAGHAWTVISDDMALCDDVIEIMCFRKDRDAKDANIYEASDIKKWLESWAAENGIVINTELVTA